MLVVNGYQNCFFYNVFFFFIETTAADLLLMVVAKQDDFRHFEVGAFNGHSDRSGSK